MDGTIQAARRGIRAARAAADEVQNALDAPKQSESPLLRVCALVLVKDAAMLPAAVREGWAEQTAALRESLGHDTAPPIERMLIEYAVVCWLRLAVMEVRYSLVVAADNTLKQIEHTEKRLTEAQKRFNRACESLARVRKLSQPSVQINVAAEGGRQLNVA